MHPRCQTATYIEHTGWLTRLMLALAQRCRRRIAATFFCIYDTLSIVMAALGALFVSRLTSSPAGLLGLCILFLLLPRPSKVPRQLLLLRARHNSTRLATPRQDRVLHPR